MKTIFEKIKGSFIPDQHERSRNARKQIYISLLVRISGMLASFILVPMALKYLGGEDSELGNLKYGIWATLTSIISFIGYFDIGVGNGLRNKFAEARAKGDNESARIYVSTAYGIFTLIFGGILILFFIFNPLIPWLKILNAPSELASEINTLVYFVIVFLLLRFIIGLISVILLAEQKTALSNSVYPIANLISLVAVFILTKYSQGSLVYLGVILSAAPVFIYFVYSLHFYSKDYKAFRPKIKYVKRTHSKSLVGLGVQFLLTQISILVISQSDFIIITQILGPEEVTPYSVAQKYFSFVMFGFTTVMSPYWSAYTQAYVKKEFDWIKKTNLSLVKVWFLALAGVILMILISKWFYLIWVGDRVSISYSLTAFMGLSVIIYAWNNIFTYFINGTGKIRLQMYLFIFGALINIPLSILFAKYFGLGKTGVIIGTCLSMLPLIIVMPLQYRKIVNQREKGIWAK